MIQAENEATMSMKEASCCAKPKGQVKGGKKMADHEQMHHEHMHHESHGTRHATSLNRTTFMATVHCLTGCSIGEVWWERRSDGVTGRQWPWPSYSHFSLAMR